MLISGIIITLILIADRIVKMLSVAYCQKSGITLIDGVLDFVFVKNTGAAFSILNKHTWILIVLTSIVCFALFYYLFFKKMSLSMRISLSCVLAGGIGNLVDRILYGYVIDMFETKFITFPVFNVADIFITCGGIAFIIFYVFNDIKTRKENTNDSQAEN